LLITGVGVEKVGQPRSFQLRKVPVEFCFLGLRP
jgi:hypothetical protein